MMSKKVLVVDDEEVIRKFLEFIWSNGVMRLKKPRME